VGGDTTIRRGGRVAVSDGSDDDRQQLRGPPLGLAGDRGVTPDVFVILTRSNLRSLVHAVARHHFRGDLGCSLQVVGRAGRDLAVEDQRFRSASAHQYADAAFEVVTRQQKAILGRSLDGVAERPTRLAPPWPGKHTGEAQTPAYLARYTCFCCGRV
jgi:hypothetical protein